MLLEFVVLGWRLGIGEGRMGLVGDFGYLGNKVKLDYYPSFAKGYRSIRESWEIW